MMALFFVAAALSITLAASSAYAQQPSERKFIREGMTEAEVLLKIGKPDSESTDTGGGAKIRVKRWIYMPAAGDTQTLTTVTLREGKVIKVERQVSR
jgi:hypothetical protein